jgi:hypothetical protein
MLYPYKPSSSITLSNSKKSFQYLIKKNKKYLFPNEIQMNCTISAVSALSTVLVSQRPATFYKKLINKWHMDGGRVKEIT